MSQKVNDTGSIRIERIWSMPNKNTFEIKPIKSLLQEEVDLSQYWIDPFANRNKLASVTNDLNTDYDTDYHLDALEFLRIFDDESIDGVLYDPPYSPRQVSECYNDVGYNVTWDTTKASFWGNHKREISRMVILAHISPPKTLMYQKSHSRSFQPNSRKNKPDQLLEKH